MDWKNKDVVVVENVSKAKAEHCARLFDLVSGDKSALCYIEVDGGEWVGKLNIAMIWEITP